MPRAKAAAPKAAALPAVIHVSVGGGLLELSADASPANAAAAIDHLVTLHEAARTRHAALRHQVTEVPGGSLAFVDDGDVGDRKGPLGFTCHGYDTAMNRGS